MLNMILSIVGSSYPELFMLGAVIFNTLLYYFTNESQIYRIGESFMVFPKPMNLMVLVGGSFARLGNASVLLRFLSKTKLS